ncbi:hypothetical protein H0H81_011460 [Sphagnurus paluster]|uniref:Inhibitor I9 domain-containing protein n=1 Tax=Sphagnurus paluster TaxID=117069 RepID=A0A9P7K3Q3_9AGAR|nr:hypothetical protein H0H81_011460 [Sphagnurus paluster]
MIKVHSFKGAKTGNYIVKLREGTSKSQVLEGLKGVRVIQDWSVIHGFECILENKALNALRASPDVEHSEDGIMHTYATQYVL